MTHRKLNPENERIKHRYLRYLRQATGKSEATVDAAAEALDRFQEYTGYRPFKSFHFEQAIGFKAKLAAQHGKSGKLLSLATQHSTLAQLRRFFRWLSEQPGFRSRMKYSDATYFRLLDTEVRVATAHREREAPTVEQMLHVISCMPSGDEIEQRDRALVAFILITGARVTAAASVRLKHIDLDRGCVHFDAREVKTKNSKTFTTYFCPVGDGPLRVFGDWVRYLRTKPGWMGDAPLFPATAIRQNGSNQFEVAGLRPEHWSNANPIREIFKRAFERAGLPYSNPHLIRNTLGLLGERLCHSVEEFKSWSQNLGHDQVLTTFESYGEVPLSRQGELIRNLGRPRDSLTPEHRALANEIAGLLSRTQTKS